MGYFLALMAIFFWSFNLIIASYFATTLMPFEIAFGRWFVAGLILVPMAWGGLVKNYQLLLKNWSLILSLALVGIVLENTLIYYAGRTAPAFDMGLLGVTGPIFLVILTRIFLKVEIGRQQLLGLMVAVFGVFVIIVNGDFTQLSKFKFVDGDFIMLLNTFFFAVYSLLQSKRPAEISQSVLLASTIIVGLIFLFPLMLWDTGEKRILAITQDDIAVIVYLGIFNSVISYLAWNTALYKIGNIKTSIMYYLLPVFGGIEAYYMLGEDIYKPQIYGGLLVIGGIALVSFHKRQKPGSAEHKIA